VKVKYLLAILLLSTLQARSAEPKAGPLSFHAPTVKTELLRVTGPAPRQVVSIFADGRVSWNGRKVHTDKQFRAAILQAMQGMCVANKP
jgi:hypothetical protein